MARRSLAGVGMLALVACQGTAPSRGPQVSVEIRSTDVGDGFYLEGYLPTTRVWGPDGSLLLERSRSAALDGPYTWPAGRYRLESWVEPCVGSCQELDQPTDRCDVRVEVPASPATTELVIQRGPGAPCEVVVVSR